MSSETAGVVEDVAEGVDEEGAEVGAGDKLSFTTGGAGAGGTMGFAGERGNIESLREPGA